MAAGSRVPRPRAQVRWCREVFGRTANCCLIPGEAVAAPAGGVFAAARWQRWCSAAVARRGRIGSRGAAKGRLMGCWGLLSSAAGGASDAPLSRVRCAARRKLTRRRAFRWPTHAGGQPGRVLRCARHAVPCGRRQRAGGALLAEWRVGLVRLACLARVGPPLRARRHAAARRAGGGTAEGCFPALRLQLSAAGRI